MSGCFIFTLYLHNYKLFHTYLSNINKRLSHHHIVLSFLTNTQASELPKLGSVEIHNLIFRTSLLLSFSSLQTKHLGSFFLNPEPTQRKTVITLLEDEIYVMNHLRAIFILR